MRNVLTSALTAALVCAAFYAYGHADAARNSSGSYSLPSGNPVVTGTTISSTWANNTLSDISTELTDSLSRSGKGGMLAPLSLNSGTVAAPALTWTLDSNSGLYRIGANHIGMSIGGVLLTDWQNFTPAAFQVHGDTIIDASGANIGTNSNFLGFGQDASGEGIGSKRSLGGNHNGLDFYTSGSAWLQISSAGAVTSVGPFLASGAVTASGLTTDTGGLAVGTGFTIKSILFGSTSWNPGTISSATGVGHNITVTGAKLNDPCFAGELGSTPTAVVSLTCGVTGADTCQVLVTNSTTGNQTGDNTTYYCVVIQKN